MKSVAMNIAKLIGLVSMALLLLHLLQLDTPAGFLLSVCAGIGVVTLMVGEEEPRRVVPKSSTDLWAEKLQVK